MIAKLSVRCPVHWPCLHYRLCQCPLCLSFQNFGRNFRLKPKFVIGFRFRPSRNRNWKIGVRFRPNRSRISAEIFGFVCSLQMLQGFLSQRCWSTRESYQYSTCTAMLTHSALSDPHSHCKQCFPRLGGPRGKHPWQGLSSQSGLALTSRLRAGIGQMFSVWRLTNNWQQWIWLASIYSQVETVHMFSILVPSSWSPNIRQNKQIE